MSTIIYQNKDISKDIFINDCILRDCSGGIADSIQLQLADSSGIWEKWQPQFDDTIQVKKDNYNTGTMYVDGVNKKDGIYTISAKSIKTSTKYEKSRVWRDITLFKFLEDIASINGLSLEKYNLKNHTYKTLYQLNQTDLEFARLICLREGYSIKINNNTLIVYDEISFEVKQSNIKFNPDNCKADFNKSDELFSSVTIKYKPFNKELIEYTSTGNIVNGFKIIRRMRIDDIAQAQRFSNAFLHELNKENCICKLKMQLNTNIAATSIIELAEYSEFSGNYFIDNITHNTTKEITIVRARRV